MHMLTHHLKNHVYSLNRNVLTPITKHLQVRFLKQYKLNTPLYHKVISDDLKYVHKIFKEKNYELRIAGGAVRDLLMNKQPQDVDLATDALPNQMLQLFEEKNVPVFNTNGIKHGTVSVRIKDRSNFEITTLRIDVKCFGRQAEVEFTNDWHLDAIRRDLTFNSLFLDFNGTVFDYVNGHDDLLNKKVRFVGIPQNRIQEDYLRILRYFRFFSQVSASPHEHDEASIKAIRENVHGLAGISSERKVMELRKILTHRYSDTFMQMFYDLRIAEYVGLPANGNTQNYSSVYEKCFHLAPSTMTLLFALLNHKEDILKLQEALKLSNEELSLLNALWKYVPVVSKEGVSDREILELFARENSRKKQSSKFGNVQRELKLKEAVEIVKYCGKEHLIERVENLEVPKFDLSSKSPLIQALVFHDHETNQKKPFNDMILAKSLKFTHLLNDLNEKWVDSNFTLTDKELVDSLTDLNVYVKPPRIKKNK